MEIIKQYIQIDRQIKELEAQKKELQAQILSDATFQKQDIDDVSVVRVIQQRINVKKDMDDIIISKFPEAVKTIVDTSKLKKIPEAAEYLEINTVEFLSIKPIKEKDEDDF